MFCFPVSEPRASVPSVFGVSAEITVQFLKPIPFFSKVQWADTMNPDLIIAGRGFYNHPSGLKKTGAGLMISDEQVNIQIVCEKIICMDDRIWFERDMSASGVFSFKIGGIFRGM